MEDEAAARQWMDEMRVPMLIEEGLRALVAAKPEDPALFLGNHFLSRAGGGSAPSGGKGKRRPSIHVNVEMPSAERMNEVTLAALLRGGGSQVVVADVRPSTDGGRIPGSEHVPCDELLRDPATHARRWAGAEAVVFVSAQSPDLDQSAAVPIMQCLKDMRSATEVFILMGGLRGWVHTYADDPSLVEDYTASVWGFQAVPAAVRRRKGPRIEAISVPEAPGRMDPATLAVLVAQESTGTVVVDVRTELAGGKIPRSVHVPCDDCVRDAARYAEQWADKDAVVFVSVQSPDLDVTAAIPFLQHLRERSAKTEVFTLHGGLRGWVHDYAGSEELLEGYDEAVWGHHEPAAAAAAPAAAPGGAQGGGHGRRRKLGVHISVPEAPRAIAAVELATLLRGEVSSPKRGLEKPLIVVDVRPCTRGGRIPGTEHIPCEDFVRDVAGYADRWAKKEAVVFVSTLSPDLDQTAATPLMHALHERGAATEVLILAEGLKGWMHDFHDDEGLVLDYSADAWANHGPPPLPSAKHRRKPPVSIAVPEAPEQMGASELALIVRAGTPGWVVVDVRPDVTGGTVAGSCHIPHDVLIRDAAKYAADWADREAVVCFSAQTPDIDVTAATALMQSFSDSGASVGVFVLSGGLRGWIQTFSGDETLTTGFEAVAWSRTPTREQ